VLGGDLERAGLTQFSGYSAIAQCTGKPAYLEPNSNSMQKPIGGLSSLNVTNYLKRGYSLSDTPEHSSKSPFATLIPRDTTLILAKTASKTIQQNRIHHQRDATPHPHGCGVKGE
jgi:hypothetical protein